MLFFILFLLYFRGFMPLWRVGSLSDLINYMAFTVFYFGFLKHWNFMYS